MDNLDRITHDPAVMGGKPCIRGMRVTVGTILGLLAAGRVEREILEAYPYLEPGDVQAALAYAAWRTQETELPLPWRSCSTWTCRRPGRRSWRAPVSSAYTGARLAMLEPRIAQLMLWARANRHILFIHDMDFGALLAATRAMGPSVLQVRVKDTLPAAIGPDVVRVLRLRREALENGALVTIDKARARVRVLPLAVDDKPEKPA